MFQVRTLYEGAWRPAIALLATLGVSMLFAPDFVGVVMIAMSCGCLFLSPEARRFDTAAVIAVWLLVLIIFGPRGAGCLILAQMMTLCVVEALGRRLLPVTALAALACVFLPQLFPGVLIAEVAAVLCIGAPGLALARLAGASDRVLFENVRCAALAPQLLAIVGGAAVAGLTGAAAALAAGWLLAPAATLLLTRRRRPGPTMAAFGTVAAGLCAALALESLRPLTPLPFALAGAGAAGLAALRLHAPVYARLLVGGLTPGRLRTARTPRPALAR